MSIVRTAFVLVFSLALFTPSLLADSHGKVTKYLRFQVGERVAYGILEGDRVRELGGDLFGSWWTTAVTHDLKEVDVLVPTKPTKVLAMAGNYRDHLDDAPVPGHPELFIKLPSSLVPHEGEIVQPKGHEPVHFEAEVVIVIGKRTRKVSEDEAGDYILGITCGNDVSARQWQGDDIQWWRAKASDTFGPCGPFIASGVDYGNLDMTLRVNGEVKQKTNTKYLIFSIPAIVSFVSQHVTLEPGDLIYTGTTGTTQGMQPGDVVTVEIEGVGTLRNRVVAEN